MIFLTSSSSVYEIKELSENSLLSLSPINLFVETSAMAANCKVYGDSIEVSSPVHAVSPVLEQQPSITYTDYSAVKSLSLDSEISDNGNHVEAGHVMGGSVSWTELTLQRRRWSDSSEGGSSTSSSLQDPVISPPPPKDTTTESNASNTIRPILLTNGVGRSGPTFNNPPPCPMYKVPHVIGRRPVRGVEAASHLHMGNNHHYFQRDHNNNNNTSRRGNFGLWQHGYAPYHSCGHLPYQHMSPLVFPSCMAPPIFPENMGYGNYTGYHHIDCDCRIYSNTVAPHFGYYAVEPYESFGCTSSSPPPPPSPPTLARPANDNTLASKIRNQIDYYFSHDNMVKDVYLRKRMDDNGWVHIYLIASFPRVEHLTGNIDLILECLKSSTVVEVKDKKVRKRHEWERWILPSSIREAEY